MRYALIFALLLSLLPARVSCQGIKGQSELTAGAGTKSTYRLLEDALSFGGRRIIYKSYGVYGISYRYYLTRKFTLGVNVTYEHISNHPIFRPNTTGYGTNNEFGYYTVTPEISRSYTDRAIGRRRASLRLYWLAAWGYTIYRQNESGTPLRVKVYPIGFQLTPIGIRMGKDLAGYAELGFGYKGILNAGLSYRIPAKKKA